MRARSEAQPERLGIAHRRARPQRGGGGGHRAGRGAGAGLADLHADDMRRPRRQRRLAGIGRGDHVHDDEGRRRRAAADLQRHQLLPTASPAPRGSVSQPQLASAPGR